MNTSLTPASHARWIFRNALLFAYVVIVAFAIGFDIFTDRSMGALMLSTLPIACIGAGCNLIGPWLSTKRRKIAWRGWLVAAMLLLLIVSIFGSAGAAQAKTGETIFTYACLMLSFPVGLLMPVEMNLADSVLRDSYEARIAVLWISCVLTGGANWWMLTVLRRYVRSQSSATDKQAAEISLDASKVVRAGGLAPWRRLCAQIRKSLILKKIFRA